MECCITQNFTSLHCLLRQKQPLGSFIIEHQDYIVSNELAESTVKKGLTLVCYHKLQDVSHFIHFMQMAMKRINGVRVL